jgi:hypothetical protein
LLKNLVKIQHRCRIAFQHFFNKICTWNHIYWLEANFKLKLSWNLVQINQLKFNMETEYYMNSISTFFQKYL